MYYYVDENERAIYFAVNLSSVEHVSRAHTNVIHIVKQRKSMSVIAQLLCERKRAIQNSRIMMLRIFFARSSVYTTINSMTAIKTSRLNPFLSIYNEVTPIIIYPKRIYYNQIIHFLE